MPAGVTALPTDHPARRKLVVLSVGPVIAHHLAHVAGLPPPDVLPATPVYSVHGLKSVEG